MRLGCSISSKNLSAVSMMKKAGYDYVEAILNEMYRMTVGELEAFRGELDRFGYKCEAVNCLFLSDIKVTGPQVDMVKIQEYLERLFERTAKLLGYEVVVFGSGGSRKLPDGFPYEKAVEQITYICNEFLAPLARKYGFKVALEELNGGETNFINFVSEAYSLAKSINLPEIGIVCDSYHIALSGQSYSVLENMGDKIVHAHTANPVKREYPKEGDGHLYGDFISAMKKAGYDKRITVESFITEGLEKRMQDSAKLFKKLI